MSIKFMLSTWKGTIVYCSWISVTFARQHTIMMRSLSQLGTWRGPNNRALTCASLAESRHRGWWRAGDTKTFAKKIIIIYWLTLILSRHFRDLLVADEISDHQLGARSQFQLDHSVRGSPVRYIDMTYRLSIYRHFWKISISIWRSWKYRYR